MPNAENQLLFKSKLIDASVFRKYRSLRYFLYGLSIVSLALFKSVKADSEDVLIYVYLGLHTTTYLVLLFLIIGLTVFIHFYSKRIKELGIIKIYSTKITLQSDNSKEYFFKDFSSLEIIRGATYHYEYQEDNVIVKFNNFIRLKNSNNSFEYEFKINSASQNKAFENMIKVLRSKVKLLYKSI